MHIQDRAFCLDTVRGSTEPLPQSKMHGVIMEGLRMAGEKGDGRYVTDEHAY